MKSRHRLIAEGDNHDKYQRDDYVDRTVKAALERTRENDYTVAGRIR